MVNVVYEYYASLSDLMPKVMYTLQQHERELFSASSNLTPESSYTLYQHAYEFFRANSGLTPQDSYEIQDHINAYFDGVDLNSTWVDEIRAQALIDFYTSIDPFSIFFEETF